MANTPKWNIRMRHEWLATPLKKKRIKRGQKARIGLLEAEAAGGVSTPATQDAAWITSREHPWRRSVGDGRVREGDLVALAAGPEAPWPWFIGPPAAAPGPAVVPPA